MRYVSLIIYTLIILLSSVNVWSQFGIRAHFDRNKYDDWSQAFNTRYNSDIKLYKNGFGVGFDYWFRLKERRVEFLPEISLHRAVSKYNGQVLQEVSQWRSGFTFHTQIYALDFEGDCNCPTFSKQGSGIDKGLFFMVSPGIEIERSELTMNPIISSVPEFTKTSNILGKLGIGLGLDLGLSDFYTITPMVAYYYYSPATWKKLSPDPDTQDFIDAKGSPTLLEASIRLGFRQDYGRGRRR